MSSININDFSNSNESGNSISKLFSQMNTNNSGNNAFGGVSLSDYAAIKNGSYAKIMKKQYGNTKSAEAQKAEDEAIKKFKAAQDVTANEAAALNSSLNELIDTDFNEDNKNKIVENIKDFADKYNKLISNASKSDSKDITQKAKWMTDMVKEYSNLLDKIGITIDADNKLSVKEEDIKKADVTSIKELFGTDVNNLASKILAKGEQIFSLAKTYGASSSAYTSSGTYNRNYASNFETTT